MGIGYGNLYNLRNNKAQLYLRFVDKINHEKDGSGKEITVRKEQQCDKCDGKINKGERAIKCWVSGARGFGGNFLIYFHPSCCEVHVSYIKE